MRRISRVTRDKRAVAGIEIDEHAEDSQLTAVLDTVMIGVMPDAVANQPGDRFTRRLGTYTPRGHRVRGILLTSGEKHQGGETESQAFTIANH